MYHVSDPINQSLPINVLRSFLQCFSWVLETMPKDLSIFYFVRRKMRSYLVAYVYVLPVLHASWIASGSVGLALAGAQKAKVQSFLLRVMCGSRAVSEK